MAVDERIQKVLVVLESDKPAAQQLQSDITRLHLALDETRKRTLSIDTAAEELQRELTEVARSRAISVLAQQAAEGKISFQQLAKAAAELGASEDEIGRVANEIGRLTENAQKANQAGIGQGALSTARSVAGTAGGVLATVGGSQAASAVSSVLGLTATLGPLGAASAAAVLALKAVTDAENARAEAAKNYQAAIEGTVGLTTESIRGQIAAEHSRIAAFQESRQTLKDFQDRVRAQQQAFIQGYASAEEYSNNIRNINVELEAATGGTLSLSDDLDSAANNIKLFDTALSTNQEAIDASAGKIVFLNTQLGTQAVAANDAAEAAARLADAQVSDAHKTLEIDRMTTEQRQERMGALRREIEVYGELIQSGNLSVEAQRQLGLEQETLYDEFNRLIGVQETYADQLEREKALKEALREGTDAVLDANTRYVEAQERLREAQEALRESSEKTGQALQRIVDERDEKIRDLEAEAAQERLDDERKYQQDRAKTVQEAAERLKEIDEQAGRSLSAARRRRDAVAAIEAKEQADDERKREGREAEKRLDELDAQLREQTQLQKRRLDEQLANARQAAQKSIQTETERARAELATRQRAAQQAVADTQNTEVALLNIQRYYNTLMEQEAHRAGAAQVSAYRAGLNTGTFNSPTPLPPVSGYQPTMPVSTGKTNTATITVQGSSSAQVSRQINRALRQVWED